MIDNVVQVDIDILGRQLLLNQEDMMVRICRIEELLVGKINCSPEALRDQLPAVRHPWWLVLSCRPLYVESSFAASTPQELTLRYRHTANLFDKLVLHCSSLSACTFWLGDWRYG